MLIGRSDDARVVPLLSLESSAASMGTERAAARAMRIARATRDFAGLAEAAEALRGARRRTLDAALVAGSRAVVSRSGDAPRPLAPGLYLVQPPMIGADARTLRETADRRDVPVLVLAREPMTRAGCWPMVAVGPQVIRAHVEPPVPLERVDASPTKDRGDLLPEPRWFETAIAALCDTALSVLEPDDPPQHRVDDLLEFVEAHPLGLPLLSALADAARAAIGAPEPRFERRRGGVDEPFGF